MKTRLQLGGIDLDIIWKAIKNVHLSVHPPTGRVRIAAPERMSLDLIYAAGLVELAATAAIAAGFVRLTFSYPAL